ncbi:RraA family protein [Sphingobacterium sp. UT-1RO-CII-1]|uniref:RraA family protein n=1 Tax=Sphingobacterium sp. UT-1RO-CII-1 TaxID=2995225 RepID=UPI00227C4D62|nr:RraA family protein [Sphingobacterium sp. UT-1RO-CII-1]MCY4780642.1 RraA family protein [Sphingobacterium sp. UT-1RO-CII-1]
MQLEWSNDKELFALVRRELFTAVIGDIMDKMGMFHQFLGADIQPLRDDMFVVGRAMTVLEADVCSLGESTSKNPVLAKTFGYMLEALDDLKEDEIYICSGSSPEYAVWGEIMSARAKMLGGAGAVVNGYSRDTTGILALDFPCFSLGRYAQDQAPRGKVIDWRVPIYFNNILINDGDILIGDIDGVCVVPKEHEAEIFTRALEKARSEKVVLQKVLEGMGAKDAFDKYGIM